MLSSSSAGLFFLFFILGHVTALPWSPPAKLDDRSNGADVTFSCEGKDYGYYADTNSKCRNFVVCQPLNLAQGVVKYLNWTFTCPDELIFNQEKLTCTPVEESAPCENSENFLSSTTDGGSTTTSRTTTSSGGTTTSRTTISSGGTTTRRTTTSSGGGTTTRRSVKTLQTRPRETYIEQEIDKDYYFYV